MRLSELSTQMVSDLGLDVPPVQISFTEEPPEGLPRHTGSEPSWCTFWGDARKEAFYVPISGHENCEIGAFVLGLPITGDLGKKLGNTLSWMQEQGYLKPGEEASIPHLAAPPKYVAYAPLGTIATTPTAVVLFARPKGAMVAMEAARRGQSSASSIPVMGRPACSVVPTVLRGEVPVAMSLGCAGFRTYVEPGDDKLLIAVRGDHLGEFARTVHELAGANEAVTDEMAHRKSAHDEHG